MKTFILIALGIFISSSHGSSRLYKRNSPVDTSLVTGGKNVTDPKKYPFIAIILVSLDGKTYNTLCGGTILNTKYILTAGRCLISFPQLISVRIGTTKAEEGKRYLTHLYDINPEYNVTSEEFNSGVVIMETPMTLDGITAKPAVLGKPGSKVLPGSVITLVGWGTDNESLIQEGDTSLRDVQIPVINQDVCAKLYEIGSTLKINENVFCAGDLNKGGKDACRGDWGDPAVINGVVVGIASSGVWCARPQSPGTYTLMAAIRPWIKSVAGV